MVILLLLFSLGGYMLWRYSNVGLLKFTLHYSVSLVLIILCIALMKSDIKPAIKFIFLGVSIIGILGNVVVGTKLIFKWIYFLLIFKTLKLLIYLSVLNIFYSLNTVGFSTLNDFTSPHSKQNVVNSLERFPPEKNLLDSSSQTYAW